MSKRGGIGWWWIGAAALALGAAPQPNDDAIRRKLTEVLERPEFHPGQNDALILQLFDRFLSWLGGLHEANIVLFWVLLGSCITLLLLLAAHIVWTVSKVFAPRQRSGEAALRAERRGRLSQEYRARALNKAADHDYTEAIRFLFLSLVYCFEESDRVRFQQACTNREYLELFAEQPRVRNEMKVFVDALDDHWYGQHPAASQQYENCLALYERLQ